MITQRDPAAFDPWGPSVVSLFLRILFVIDGRINTSDNPDSFGLKLVLDTLRDPSFSPSVRFRVDVVRRDKGELLAEFVSPTEDIYYTAPGDELPFSNDHLKFTFTDPKFNIDTYDQIWFFGDYPANYAGSIDSPEYYSLGDDELRLLADWMDRGGGVFAAGDHWNLGASMCSRIPRVRTMRKWTLDQLVPPQFGDLRNETLQGAPPSPPQPDNDPREGDATPQPIEPVYRARATSILVRPLFPHGLLIAPDGALIDKFPDHMHEGEVIEDTSVELNKPLNISGYTKPEYPSRPPQVLEDVGTVAQTLELPSLGPRPHVVAHARTTLEIPVPHLEVAQGPGRAGVEAESAASLATSRKVFGLISAYDGQGVGIGRVVTESTWHHWFSLNLNGLRDGNPLAYQHMQAYYRNVALWLATAAQRQSILVSAIWAAVILDPMGLPVGSGQTVWSVGKKAVGSVLGTMPSGILFDCVASFFDGREEEIFGVPAGVDPAAPFGGCLPPDLAVRALVGGIASALLRPAQDYLKAGNNERRHVDPDAIVRYALEGAQLGKTAFVEAVRSSAVASEKLADLVEGTFRPLPMTIQVERIPLRIVADRLQLPDPTDPALADGHLSLTIRLSIGGVIVASEVFDAIDVSSLHPGGIFVTLERVLYEGLVQERERLVLDVLTGTPGHEPVASERLRFEATLAGKPSNWIGRHIPSLTQSWRLWYRIEPTDIPRGTPK